MSRFGRSELFHEIRHLAFSQSIEATPEKAVSTRRTEKKK
jgi:hypothetical protein